jgi:hypothetical protein
VLSKGTDTAVGSGSHFQQGRDQHGGGLKEEPVITMRPMLGSNTESKRAPSYILEAPSELAQLSRVAGTVDSHLLIVSHINPYR